MAMTGDQIEVLETEQGGKKLIDEGSREKEFFDENGKFHFSNGSMQSNFIFFFIGIFTGVVPKETLESQLIASGNIQAKDIPGIVKFLKTCLQLTSWKRPKAGDLMFDEWLVPAFACSCGFTGY